MMSATRVSIGTQGRVGLGALLVVAFPALGLAAPAARVEFAIGDVQVIAPSGQARSAQKGTEVNNGDTVSTNRGRAQLRFTDGAYVSLQPQSDFRVDDYRYEGRADGSERGFFSLLKGGLRTITGVVGRTNKKNYQVGTSVATIGIRGTEYTLAYTASITGSVGEGEIEVCTVRCVPFRSGESFFVQDAQSLPQLTLKKTDLPPPQPDTALEPLFVANDNVEPNGEPSGLLLTGTQANMTVADNGDGLLLSSKQTVVFSSAGVPQSIGGQALTSLVEYGNRDLIAWGRQTSGAFSFFFVTGPSMLSSDLAALQVSQPVATYQFIGGTTPVGSGMLGELLGGTLTAYFGQGKVDASVSVKMGSVGLDIASKGMVISALSAVTFADGACTVAGGSCDMKGFFVGPTASSAGIVYEAFTSAASASGAAAFVKAP
jgi:hypothetical protein